MICNGIYAGGKTLDVEDSRGCSFIWYAQWEFMHFEDFSYSFNNLIQMDVGEKIMHVGDQDFPSSFKHLIEIDVGEKVTHVRLSWM